MSLEFNKGFAAVLTAGIVFMGAGVVGSQLVKPHRLHEPAITLGAVAPTAAPAAAPAALEPIGPVLAAANADNGRAIAGRVCGSCHTFNEGGRSGVGPNLYGIVGANHAHVAGFNYSAGMKAKSDQPWDYEALNTFIAGPARAIPGTRMAYAGMNSTAQRADLIAFLRSLSANPAPLP
ncbi:cytochrome c family protein [Roseococcus sp. SYP-B2431]|uniref:c-type cytochrome n=1 Tax=Roseococcus sp. SYP-B2431 TaxID=2496640 RepID=UPI001040ADED|nr:cytochrome c family protein [Roseococcus sp. SYP-B2431]TCH98861.1 cytochrome c family protein [Roseococcus sp. SYP-B2431]